MKDTRTYDQNGNRDDEPTQEPDDLDARTAPQATAPKVDPMDLLKDIGNPDADQPAAGEEEGGGSFQEEELW